MADANSFEKVNEIFADVYERLSRQEQALVELLYDAAALKSLLTPEQMALFERSKRSQAEDLGNAVTASRNLSRYDEIIARLRGSS